MRKSSSSILPDVGKPRHLAKENPATPTTRAIRDISLEGIHRSCDHGQSIAKRARARIARLGCGVAVQHRTTDQRGDFLERYGTPAVEPRPR
jgi:hypothetical protein